MSKNYLNPVIVVLFSLISMSAESASFIEKSAPTHPQFLKLWNTVENFAEVEYSQRGRETRSFKIFMKQGEDLQSAIRQNVYERRAEWGVYSTPERVEVKYLRFTDKALDLDIFWYMFMTEYSAEEGVFHREQMKAIRMFLKDARARKNFALFRVRDYNTYGECDTVAFFDRKSFELSFLGTCYAE